MKRPDRKSSLFWLGFAGFICVESFRLPLGSLHEPGPGFLPLLTGVLLAGLSVVCFLQAGRAAAKKGDVFWYSGERWKNLLWVLVALLIYAGILDFLGFVFSTFLLLAFLFRFGTTPQRWIWAIGGGALASVSCYAVFELWLRTNLPKGILGF
jgi:putative tricarboxylic transport membrane protein